MLYNDIIINEIKGILFFENYFFTLAIIIFLILFYHLYKQIFFSNKINKLILLIRITIIILLLPIFNNKVFNNSKLTKRSQNLAIVIDNSASVGNIIENDSLDIFSNLKKIEKISNEKINLNWYNLDASLSNYNSVKFDRNETSFSNIKNIIQKDNNDQIILISDGNVNSEIITNNLSIPNDKIVHTLGLGSISTNSDIGIYDVNLLNSNDTIYVDVTFSVDISNNSRVIFKINNYDSIVDIDTININKGKYFFEKSYKYNQKFFDNQINLSIKPNNFIEFNEYNNNWIINNYPKEKLKVLFISSSLSYNTMFIKRCMSDINLISFDHFQSTDNNFNLKNINTKNYDCIILDNFPNNLVELDYFKKLFNQNKPILFVEGYDFKLNSLFEFLNNTLYSNFYIENNFKIKSLSFNNEKNLSNVPTTSSIYLKGSVDKSEHFFYDDKSLYQYKKDNFLGLFIPNIGEFSFYLKNKNNDLYIEEYFKYLIDKHFERNSLYRLNLNKKNYILGDNLNIKLYNNLPYDVSNQNIIIKNIENLTSDTINYNKGEKLILSKPGKFEVFSSYIGTNSKEINSNKEVFYVEDISLEKYQTNQNVDLLKSISTKYNGTYTDISNFNDSWRSKIYTGKIDHNIKLIYTALEIFIKEQIYLLVIILFCLEIYLRKKTGLL